MAKVHEQGQEEVDDGPDHPEPDLENHFHKESYSMQDSEIEDLLESHTLYTENMASHTIFPNILLPLWIFSR